MALQIEHVPDHKVSDVNAHRLLGGAGERPCPVRRSSSAVSRMPVSISSTRCRSLGLAASASDAAMVASIRDGMSVGNGSAARSSWLLSGTAPILLEGRGLGRTISRSTTSGSTSGIWNGTPGSNRPRDPSKLLAVLLTVSIHDNLQA